MANEEAKRARVFVCWSGDRSKDIAERLKRFLEQVIPEIKDQVFISTNLEKGVRWFEEIVRNLEDAQAGILCLTAENLRSPWLHFEAGALAKGLQKSSDTKENRIFTYLHGTTVASLAGPLEQYQSASTTREDTRSLIKALIGVLFPGNGADYSLSEFDKSWQEFESYLKGITVTVQKLLPDFERWFRRKTFEEPLQQCTDQNWPRRYDGTRETHKRLSEHLASVRTASPRYQIDLYEQLLAAVDSYAMDISALLLKPQPFRQPFDLGDTGELVIEPKGILRACENHRAHIREIVSRILDPMAVPATEEAAVFWLTDSSEQRKMFVHRYEHAISEKQKRPSPKDESPCPRSVIPSNVPEARELFKSIWDLDRILGYLAMEYRFPDDDDTVDSLWPEIMKELERFSARMEGATRMPMPLYYALGALKTALGKRKKVRSDGRSDPKVAPDENVAKGLKASFEKMKKIIEKSKPPGENEPTLDKDGWLRWEIDEIEQLLPHSIGLQPSPAALASKSAPPTDLYAKGASESN